MNGDVVVCPECSAPASGEVDGEALCIGVPVHRFAVDGCPVCGHYRVRDSLGVWMCTRLDLHLGRTR